MVLKVLQKFPPTLVLVHGWLFPETWRVAGRLSGMFRRSASLAIPHLKSFAAIPSVSLGQQCRMVVFAADDLGFFGAQGSGPRDRALSAPRHCLDA